MMMIIIITTIKREGIRREKDGRRGEVKRRGGGEVGWRTLQLLDPPVRSRMSGQVEVES